MATTIRNRFASRPEALMLAALTASAIALIAAAVIGGRSTAATASAPVAAPVVDESGVPIQRPGDLGDLVEGPAIDPQTPSGGTASVPGDSVDPDGPVEPGEVKKTTERASELGATREGIHSDHFEIGIHAPITFDGAPLNLAEDPIVGLKGYVTWVNQNGGVNGLKARIFIEDDRYTTTGGRQVADKLVTEIKPFMVQGTLGIDQIHKVASAAREAKIPYMGGGGPELEFANGMYQIISSYDQYLTMVTDFICTYGVEYVGGTSPDDIRLGTTTLNSELILPVEERFIEDVTARGCVRTPIDEGARGTINKPTEQSTYGGQMIDLRTAYDNLGANLVVPLQDPITTARQVLEWSKSGYRPQWTAANFAHDGDTALALFQGEWTGMRVMSGACYYHPDGGGQPYNESKCAKLGKAHEIWTKLGPVTFDENAGGCGGGKCEYEFTDDSWTTDGSGGATGYQLVYFWHGAMKKIGADPTREKLVAALNDYDTYSNLITGPISFKGSDNTMVGATKFVLLEGQANLKYRQVTEITPGLVDHF